VDIAVSTVPFILNGTNSLTKGLIMNSNNNELLSLTGFQLAKLGDQFEAKYGYESDTSNTGDVSKLLAMNTQTPSNAGVTFEMQALGFEGEVVAEAAPSMSSVKVDKTDWENMIR
tara:strand:+ start:1644 stop:1988 length:345 start_codon:yes stop_codon:yes gene_type:complete